DCLTNLDFAVSVSPNMASPPKGASMNVGDCLPSQRVSMLIPEAGVQRRVEVVSASVALAPPKIKLPFSTFLSPSIRQPKLVSPSKSRIHPSSISFGVSVLGFVVSSAQSGQAANM